LYYLLNLLIKFWKLLSFSKDHIFYSIIIWIKLKRCLLLRDKFSGKNLLVSKLLFWFKIWFLKWHIYYHRWICKRFIIFFNLLKIVLILLELIKLLIWVLNLLFYQLRFRLFKWGQLALLQIKWIEILLL
jgi:hypothetical protein